MASSSAFIDDLHGDDELEESTLRLKDALTISELSQGTGFTFEVDTADEVDKLDLEFLDYGSSAGNNYYMKEYIGDKNLKSQALLDSITPDEGVGDFVDSLPQMTDLSSAGKVKKLIMRKGTSKDVVPYDGKITFHYVAYAEGKEGVIDSSVASGSPYSCILSTGSCIEGLSLGLQSMKLGEISKFWFHFDVAYKALGVPPRIPPRANILCVVEVISVMHKEQLQNVLQMSREERLQVPFDKIMSTGEDLRLAGNQRYEQKDFSGAIARYAKGIVILDNYPVALMAQDEMRCELLGTLYSNVAQAFLKTNQPGKACTAIKNGLRIPKYRLRYKLFFKFAKAKAMFKDYSDSINLCQKAIGCLSLEQKEERAEIETYMREIRNHKWIEDQNMKKIYGKMLGKEENGKGNNNEK